MLVISIAQMDIALNEPAVNIRRAGEYAAEAARRGSHVLVLPELWTTGYDFHASLELATQAGDSVWRQIAELAREHQLWLVSSVLCQEGAGPPRNSGLIFSPEGELAGRYDKLHLFRGLIHEDRYLAAGSEAPLIELTWGRAALALCYDLRFPELFRRYTFAGADVIFVPAEWPDARREHWELLLRARAVENLLFVVACNRVGRDAVNTYPGHSAIFNPWGEAVVAAGRSEVLLTAAIELDAIRRYRERLPALNDRRPEVY